MSMTPNEFLETVRTNHKTEYAYVHTNTISEVQLHAAIGISTEAGELLDVSKKGIIYGKAPDIANIKEELGDLLWYIGLAIIDLGSSFSEIFEINAAKLAARYSQGQFTENEALERDLDTERLVIEATAEQHSFDQTTLTRAFIHLNEMPPKDTDKFKYQDNNYTYDGATWTKDNDNTQGGV